MRKIAYLATTIIFALAALACANSPVQQPTPVPAPSTPQPLVSTDYANRILDRIDENNRLLEELIALQKQSLDAANAQLLEQSIEMPAIVEIATPAPANICDRSIPVQEELLSEFNTNFCSVVTFQELQRLQSLDIDYDAEFYPNDFLGMTNLKLLRIRFYDPAFDPSELEPLIMPENLRHLQIMGIDATRMPLAERQNIQAMTVRINPSNLHPSFFDNMTSLTGLEIRLSDSEESGYGHNLSGYDRNGHPVAKLPDNLFHGAPNLKALSIIGGSDSRCLELSELTLAGLSQLEGLMIGPSLRKIPRNAIVDLASLTQLDIRGWSDSCYLKYQEPQQGEGHHQLMVANRRARLALEGQGNYEIIGISPSR